MYLNDLKNIIIINNYMKYKSLNFIKNYILEIIYKETDIFIKKISNDYNLNYNTLKKKYLDNINHLICENIHSKHITTNIKNTIDSKIRCLGIIKSGAQCARTRKHNCEFCLIHQKSLKFGKVHI